jgi:hypothetical protein
LLTCYFSVSYKKIGHNQYETGCFQDSPDSSHTYGHAVIFLNQPADTGYFFRIFFYPSDDFLFYFRSKLRFSPFSFFIIKTGRSFRLPRIGKVVNRCPISSEYSLQIGNRTSLITEQYAMRPLTYSVISAVFIRTYAKNSILFYNIFYLK